MEYSGRGITIGMTPDEKIFAVYTLTGRSPSSQARRLVMDDKKKVKIEVTDEEQLKKGNPSLLVYNAMIPLVKKDGVYIVVSNGAQTDLLYKTAKTNNAGATIDSSLYVAEIAFRDPKFINGIDITSYEPDAPNFTPRISGVISYVNNFPIGTLHLVKKEGEKIKKETHNFEPELGEGWLITTYSGENINPLPPFDRNPFVMKINSKDVGSLVESAFNAIEDHFGVSAAAMTIDKDRNIKIDILNKY